MTGCNPSKLLEADTPGEKVGVSIRNLECGASLAEAEHGVDSKDETREMGFTRKKQDDNITTVESIRKALASERLTSDGNFLETFASPFETPTTLRNESSSRFLSVPLVFCDHTASNQPVYSIERYMAQVCLPLYGNTHTNTSITGSQSTAFVAEARQIVAESTNARITGKASLDVVLFAGNGCTSAVELLIDILGLKKSAMDKDKRPVVFVGPYEHHSNLLPWRESGCEIVAVPECTSKAAIDLEAMDKLLALPRYASRLKMGTFTAASNLTGAVSNVDDIAGTLHRHGALAFFDYATGAPYLPMNMNPPPSETYPSAAMICKDAIFLSPHKMMGGVGTPGVLVVKKHLVDQVNAPSRSGGGTVFYVTNSHHRFLSNRVERYEGGTPNVAGIIRTGLTFLLKRRAEEEYTRIQKGKNVIESPATTILEYDIGTHKAFVQRLQRTSNLVMLGDSSDGTHLPIISFLVRCGRRFLHFNYVCAILNDVFGIQSRGGCQCAGPYAQRLLGLTKRDSNGRDFPNETNQEIEHALIDFKERAELLRPGFTRLSLPFKGLDSDEVEYVVRALEWVANSGWALMCQYTCNHRTGEWRHQSRQGKPLGRNERRWLSHYEPFGSSGVPLRSAVATNSVVFKSVLEKSIATADALLADARADRQSIAQALKMNAAEVTLSGLDDSMEHLRWYAYPKECAIWINEGLLEPPETQSSEILGALQPVAAVDVSNELGQQESLKPMIFSSLSLTTDSRKRKLSPVRVPSAPVKALHAIDIDTTLATFAFRDGEHVGDAPVDDILGGYQDGELSETCQVFDQRCHSWISVQQFLEGSFVKDSSCSSDKLSKNLVYEHKKPSRDSTAWGQTCLSSAAEKSRPHQETDIVTDQNGSGSTKVTGSVPTTKKTGRGVKPPPKMMRYITQAVFQWNMIEEGDKLLLGLSGGKDSLSLLHCLLELRRKLPISFDIEVCTIDPMTPSFDPSPLIPYVEAIGLNYHYIRDDIVNRANNSGKDGKTVSSLCAYCARMKRGNLYSCARRNNCNKLVLAQHLDDLAESFLMSTFHNGFVRTMKANYRINSGDLAVIRPMVYCRESLMTDFAKTANLPVINENCPACFEEPKERARVKKLLSREETLYPDIYDNIRRSLIPLMHDDTTSILRSYLDEVLARNKKENQMNFKKKIMKRKGLWKDRNNTINALDRIGGQNGPGNDYNSSEVNMTLSSASEEQLVSELARRRAEKFRLAGAMKRLGNDNDPTGQVCTLNGGDGTIPCRELME